MAQTLTYQNEIVERDVSLAIEQLLIAPTGATVPPVSRINITSPPSGFIHVGSVVEDSPTVTINREKYTLATGIPSATQYDCVTGMSGQFAISFYSNATRIVEYALGAASRKYTTSVVSSISTATSRVQLTVNSAVGMTYVGAVIVANATSCTNATN